MLKLCRRVFLASLASSVAGCSVGIGTATIFYTDPLSAVPGSVPAATFRLVPAAGTVCAGGVLVPRTPGQAPVAYTARWYNGGAGAWVAGTVTDGCTLATPVAELIITFPGAGATPNTGYGLGNLATGIELTAGPSTIAAATALLPGRVYYNGMAASCAVVPAPATWTININC